jgi:hypothetical protein
MSVTTIDQPGTLTALLTLSTGEDYVIQHDTSSTAAVVVTLTPTVGLTLGDIYTVQDGATLVAETGISAGFGNEFVIGPGGTFEQLSGLGANVLSEVSFAGGTVGGELVIGTGISLSVLSSISGFSNHDTIDLQGIGTPVSFTDSYSAGDTYFTITTGSGTDTFELHGNLTNNTFSLASDGNGGILFVDAPCFCEGTLIRTETGETRVEQLQIGDMVQTHSGAARRIKWIGNRSYDGKFIAGNHLMLPICIKADAIADGVPARNLHVSPGHAIYCSGTLVPAWRLVNGVSITQAEQVDRVTYYHVELESHDVIFAENCPAESFLDDTGFRGQFHNAAEFSALYPEDKAAPGLERTESWYLLAAIQRQLAARAGVVLPTLQTGALQGFVDQAGPCTVSGWAQNADAPEAPISLDIINNGRRVARVLANLYRADLRKAGLGSGCHGFEIHFSTGLSGQIEVRRTVDQIALNRTTEAMVRAA